MTGILTTLLAGLVLCASVSAQADEKLPSEDFNLENALRSNEEINSIISAHVDRIEEDSIAAYMQELVDFKTRFMLADNRRDIALWIQDRFKDFGYTGVVLDSFQNAVEFPFGSGEMHTTWQYNVIAGLEGSQSSDTLLVLGAHYDCATMGPNQDPLVYSPGANNNASGMAVCLEIARLIRQNNLQARYALNFVAFGSEEFMTMFAEGGSGAEHYVSQIKESGRHVILMIDNNQVSHRPSADDWRLDFQNCPGSQWVTDAARYVARKYTRIVPVDSDDHINFSDVYYFWSAGFPAIFFEEFHFCPYTFTDKDIPENCDMEYCAEVAKISLALLLDFNYRAPDW